MQMQAAARASKEKRSDPPPAAHHHHHHHHHQPEEPWAAVGLHVRLVSKSFRNGAFYNRKGIVQDVTWVTAAVDDGKGREPPAKRARGDADRPRELRAVVRLDERPHEVVTGM